MNKMEPDVIVQVRLLTTKEGGRKKPIKGMSYSCPMFFNGKGFDCRVVANAYLDLQLGKTYDLSLKFMNPDMIVPRLEIGSCISFWEGKTIAVGTVTKVLSA